MPPNNKVLLDQVIESLEIATQLDKSGRHRIEAATKYYESCYLIRQILAGDAGEGSSSVCSTISTTCRRLLEDKIEYYTKVAQRLYFDDSASVAAGGESPAPTSVIISLLDDVVSVLTSTNHPLEQQQQPSSSDPFTATLPQQQYFHPRNVPTTTTKTSTAVATTRSNPSTLLQLPVQATIVRRGGGRETVGAVNNRNNPESLSKQQQQQQQQQLRRHSHNNDNNNNIRTTGTKPRPRLSKFAKVEAERKIHIKMNLANSKLGQSIDLDEYCHSQQQSNNQNNNNNIIIDSYVDASEFYLDAIKLAEDHQKKYDNNSKSHLKLSLSSKVDPWRGPGASPSPSPIGSVIPKLKHLLISALDRVETLKKKMKKTDITTKIITKKTLITPQRYSRSPHHSSYSNHHRNYDFMEEKKQLSSCLSSTSASSSLPSLSLTATIIVNEN